MGRRTRMTMVLLAWLVASGAHWDLVQTVAWGRMFAGYARIMPAYQAAKLTFAPGNLCALCKVVNEGRKQGGTTPVPDAEIRGKLLLIFQPASRVILDLPPSPRWAHCDLAPASALPENPPTPPPRVA